MLSNKILINLLILLLIYLSQVASCQEPQKIPSQNEKFPLYTHLDSTDLHPFRNVFRWKSFRKDSLLLFREFLQNKIDQGDAYADYLYAQTYDLFPYGQGTPEEGQIALNYYQKAATRHLALAEFFLYEAYRYGHMHLNKDSVVAYRYLLNFLSHSNHPGKAKAYKALASWHPESDTSSILHSLEKALAYDSLDTWSLDYLAFLYEQKGWYDRALPLLLRSDNQQSHLKAAEWLVWGERIPQNKSRGLSIIYRVADRIPDYRSYMGVRNPVYMLNHLYRCDKLITKEEVGAYYLESYLCKP